MGELQEVKFIGHYGIDQKRGNPRTGWAYILLISDFSENTPAPVPINAMKLRQTWGEEWQGLASRDESAARISESIDALRDAVLHALRQLD